MNPNSQKNMLLTTDYPTDTVFIVGGSESIPAGSHPDKGKVFTVSTSFTVPMLAIPCYSLSQDFSEQFFLGIGAFQPPTTGFVQQPDNDSMTVTISPSIGISSDTFDITVVCLQGATAPARTLYYRFALFPIDGSVLPHNSTDNIDFIFNTDNNYLKILETNVNDSSMGTPYTVSTGLNHAPTVLPFHYLDLGGGSISIEPIQTGSLYADGPGVSLGKNNMVESTNNGNVSFSSMAVQSFTDSGYRIYIDE